MPRSRSRSGRGRRECRHRVAGAHGTRLLALTGAADSVREAKVVATASNAERRMGRTSLRGLCPFGERCRATDAVPDELVVGARALDAPVLEAWVRGLVALAGVRAGEPDRRDEAFPRSVARTLGVDGARLIAHLALAEASTDPVEEEEHRSEAAALARETGLRAPGGFARRVERCGRSGR